MTGVSYPINKGINKSIEFKGLKAQYIGWLGGGLVVLLILFAGMYCCGLNNYICVVFLLTAGTALVTYVYRLSARYGQHGLMKRVAARGVPPVIVCRSRKVFMYEQQKNKR